MTLIQIYCRNPSLGETKALLDMGVELIGWHVKPDDGAGLMLSRWLADLVRDRGAKSSLLVHEKRTGRLATIAEMVRPDYLLMSSARDDEAMPALAARLGSATKLMMTVPVRVQGSTIDLPSKKLALEYAAYSGALTVDTTLGDVKSFGCTGRTNDWEICREIVAAVKIPVVLAGGLTPENVAESIRSVRPPIVDACTSLELADRSKDLERCRAFVDAVRSAG